ncbi:serine/threonine-protein kinase [Actinomyces ruminis]|uniref:non-specific serine/threonine protein kinase n=1 Tax=Actinomyces ruminis TaxID=1937003 RepID=A0ABX4MF83_9ACTO|nr:serine/threonine-protein kinase [Actinomyces ruminis]PHP52680.1 serine/threonine protein kinase [Actinomyces ruminis]
MPPINDAAQRLGSAYVLDSRIGAGAQGDVWLAHRSDAPGIPLAVKLLRADLLEDAGVVERFIRERATLMRVASPYVVGVQDMVIEGSRFAIVMDYVGGGNLRGLLNERGVLPPAEVARVGAMLASGLATVHDAGIVHRDIKPANVLIATSGESADPADGDTAVIGRDTWTPRLADFGVARICDTVASSRATGAIGTPLYMAPEILDPAAPTPAADVYSLGVLLYEAACGITPFVGAPSQVLAQHARRAPGRPDGVPDALWHVLERMLAKQPAARPSAHEVAAALQAAAPALAGSAPARRLTVPPPSAPAAAPYLWAGDALPEPETAPTLVGPASPGPGTPATVPLTPPPTMVSASSPPRRSRRRRRALFGVIAAAVVLAVAVGGVITWRHRTAGAPGSTAVAALPAQADTIELQRITDVDEYRLAPNHGALAAETSYKHWSLYDLDAVGQAPVWSDDCDSAGFWTNETFLCVQDDAGQLIGLDGAETGDVLAFDERTQLGTTGSTAIVIDGSYSGSLVALDASGEQLWRRDGSFRDAHIGAGFIVTYETGSERLLVLSAETGEVLLSEAAENTPDFDSSLPGGIGIDVGTQAFYKVDGEAVTVYDATGTEVGTVDGVDARSDWVLSDAVSAEQLVELLRDVAADNSVHVRGRSTEAGLAVDAVTCTVTGPDGASYTVPERTDGEACVITPEGLIGKDEGVLFTMGQPSSRTDATGDHVIAYDLDDGEQLWRVAGTLVGVLPPSDNAAGKAAGAPRMLVAEGDDLVIHAVVGK